MRRLMKISTVIVGIKINDCLPKKFDEQKRQLPSFFGPPENKRTLGRERPGTGPAAEQPGANPRRKPGGEKTTTTRRRLVTGFSREGQLATPVI